MTLFAIVLIISIIVWGIMLLDALISGRSQRTKGSFPLLH